MKGTLQPYQVQAKDFIKSHSHCGLFLDMGLGKACDDETIIPTPSGQFVRLGDVKVGDKLIGKNGKPTTVLAVYHHTDKIAYEVTLKDDRKFICCDEHLVPFYDESGNLDCKQLKDMLDDYKIVNEDYIKYKYKIPLSDAVEYPERNHIISPYNLGCFLAGLASSGPDENELKRLDLWGKVAVNRFIPNEYLIDSVVNRRELLNGLMNGRRGIIIPVFEDMIRKIYELPDCALTDDIIALHRSLGYEVFTTFENDKISMVVIKRSNIESENAVSIIDIKQVPNRNMTCFTVDADDHLFLINDYIVTHNTLTTLAAIEELKNEGKLNGHILVIAPKNIARATWVDEIKKWGFDFRYQSLIINEKGNQLTSAKREKIMMEALTAPPTIYFANREIVKKILDFYVDMSVKPNGQYRFAQGWIFKTVVVDELQSFKSFKSERFKALKSVSAHIERFIGLTGTPTPNGLEDLWSQIYLMDRGARLGPNITKYRNTFFVPGRHMNGYPIEFLPKQGAEQEIYSRIKDIVISMKNTMIKLPDITFNNVYAYMTGNEYNRYRQFAKKQVLELSDGGKITVANAAVLSAKLSQMASGAIYLPDEEGNPTHNYEIIHEHKLEQLEYIVNNTDSPVLVAYHFKSDKEMIVDYFHKNKDLPEATVFDGTPEMLHAWNEGKIPVLLLQPASAGHGLNFQQGGHTLVWYTVTWSLEEYLQTNARLYRQGQTHPVVIHHILMHNTVDERILNRLSEKDEEEQSLLDAVSAEIDSIINDKM